MQNRGFPFRPSHPNLTAAQVRGVPNKSPKVWSGIRLRTSDDLDLQHISCLTTLHQSCWHILDRLYETVDQGVRKPHESQLLLHGDCLMPPIPFRARALGTPTEYTAPGAGYSVSPMLKMRDISENRRDKDTTLDDWANTD